MTHPLAGHVSGLRKPATVLTQRGSRGTNRSLEERESNPPPPGTPCTPCLLLTSPMAEAWHKSENSFERKPRNDVYSISHNLFSISSQWICFSTVDDLARQLTPLLLSLRQAHGKPARAWRAQPRSRRHLARVSVLSLSRMYRPAQGNEFPVWAPEYLLTLYLLSSI